MPLKVARFLSCIPPVCRGILAPILPSSQEAQVGTRDGESEEEGGQGGEEEEKEVAPIMSVTAWKKGSQFDADVKLASFACNLMVEPIKVGHAWVRMHPWSPVVMWTAREWCLGEASRRRVRQQMRRHLSRCLPCASQRVRTPRLSCFSATPLQQLTPHDDPRDERPSQPCLPSRTPLQWTRSSAEVRSNMAGTAPAHGCSGSVVLPSSVMNDSRIAR